MNLNRHFIKEDIQMANTHKKACFASLIIREKHENHNRKPQYTSIRMDFLRKDNITCLQRCGATATFIHC